MSRTKVVKNISYDEKRQLYYVSMNYGKDPKGKRIRKFVTFKTEQEAKLALQQFETDKTNNTLLVSDSVTVRE